MGNIEGYIDFENDSGEISLGARGRIRIAERFKCKSM